jgi:hypothetical protein
MDRRISAKRFFDFLGTLIYPYCTYAYLVLLSYLRTTYLTHHSEALSKLDARILDEEAREFYCSVPQSIHSLDNLAQIHGVSV